MRGRSRRLTGLARRLSRWPLDDSVDVNAGGLARARPTVNLTLRLMSRAYLLSSGGVTPGAESSAGLAAAFAAGDLALSGWLARTTDSWLLPRLVVDALDQAFWSRRYLTADRVIFAGAPLATEVAIGLGAGGLIVPAVNYAAIWAARRGVGLKTSPVIMTGQVVAVGIGAALGWFARRHDRDIVDRARADAEARRTAGYIAGQNAVTAGADSVVDLLARTEPLIATLEREAGRRPQAAGTAAALHAWKAQLAVVTSDHAAYLGTVLRSWARARQSADLHADITLSFTADVGTTVVTAMQAAHLRDTLDGLGLVGEVEFTVLDAPEVRRPGRAFTAAVGDQVILVPDDPASSPPAFDPVPLMVAAGGVSVAATTLPAFGGTPWWMALPATSAGFGLAAWVRRRRSAGRPVDVHRLMDLLLGMHCLTASGIVTTRRHPIDAAGRTLLPQADGYLVSTMLLAGFVSRQLDGRQAASLVTKAAASVTPPLHLAGSLHPRHLTFGSLAPMMSFIGTRGMFGHVEDHRNEIVAEWERAASLALEAGYRDGHQSVVGLVSDACEDARRRLEALERSATVPDGRVLAEAERRLAEAERTLAELGDAEISSLAAWLPTSSSARAAPVRPPGPAGAAR